MRRALQRGEPTPLNIWSLSNSISNVLEPLQTGESLKAPFDVEQESKKKDIQSAEENVLSQVDKSTVLEDGEGEESQDAGDDSPPSSFDKTDLDIRKAERLTARLEMQELLRQGIKKERENFPVKKRERKEIKKKRGWGESSQ